MGDCVGGHKQEQNKQIVPVEPSSVQAAVPQHRRIPPKYIPIAKGATILLLLGFAEWLFQNFLQLRGVISLWASRIDLVLLFLALVLIGWLITARAKRRTVYWCTTVIVCLSLVVGLDIWAPKPAPLAKQPPQNQHRLATLKELFENGWPDLPAYYSVSTFEKPDHSGIDVPWRLNGDFWARSRFLEFFMGTTVQPADAMNVCMYIANNYQEFINAADSHVDIAGRLPQDTSATHMKDMVFSGRIFIYYDNPDFSLEQKASLETIYKQRNLSIQFRDADYAWLHREDYPPFRATPLVPNNFLLPDPKGDAKGIKITVRNLGQ